ncbi:Two-component response regulator, YesN/AraC family, consists of REC and AraC-type DNA-binding domains [Paenibacillus sp. 1_12]|uniref:response regulator transcription factor n=1 Tax=Paenibacillus sp. 1_12 TaxID=1566278 RepID=UPI0008DFC752|nr:response regulator [Paenibacillus sp. 1_12]SFK97269.1 Two-component response regulator, YesN/AraC family, consists of REC and AraC-type DNA-binding domains [Paenibacillus sp. 1_12]
MLKVMIVEDEDIVREDIKHLIDWEQLGFEIIAEARNGSEGLRTFLEHNPDVIITDIKMPVMGGLEMITNILQIRKNKKIILLTSYGDFNFARQAIQLGIHSYVLKHELDGALLIQELDKLKQQLQEEESVGYLARREQLRMFLKRLESMIDDAGMIVRDDLFRWKGRTGICMLGFDLSPPSQEYAHQRSIPVDRKKFIDFMYARSSCDIEAEIVDVHDNEYIIFYKIPERSSERTVFEYSSHFASHLQSEVTNTFFCTISVAIGPVFENHREIRESLKKARELYALRIFKKGSSIFVHPRKQPDGQQLQSSIDLKLKEIQEYLNHEQYTMVNDAIDVLLCRLLVALEDTSALKSSIFELIRLINLKAIPKHGTPMIESFDALSELQQLGNVYQIAEWFKHMITRLEEESNSKYSKKIRELLQYIHANYSKDITLNEIADRMGFSLIYTSQLFKKEVGVTFITYLTQYRIEKARELLASGQYKVYEVSSMVGYQTVQYFSKTFKKVTGLNPGDL